MNEVKKVVIKDVGCSPYHTKCIKCGNEITLWFNGGELDYKECCDYSYSLDHGRIDFVIEKIEKK